jgi:hypothetical protein
MLFGDARANVKTLAQRLHTGLEHPGRCFDPSLLAAVSGLAMASGDHPVCEHNRAWRRLLNGSKKQVEWWGVCRDRAVMHHPFRTPC